MAMLNDQPADLVSSSAGLARVAVLTLPLDRPGWTHNDDIAIEAPLEVRIGASPLTVLMRTPGHDSELVSGFLFGEGVIDDPDEILAIDRPADVPAAQRDDVVSVALAVRRRPRGAERLFYSSSGCGICGKRSLDSIEVRSIPVQSDLTIPLQVLSTLPDSLRAAQALFSRSGGVHAAGLFTPTGERVLVREDVGRHNALDKVLGWALAEGRVPLSQHLVVMSSRLSFELVQKAIAAGIPLIAAVGAPSSLAVELGERFGVTLVGFLRDTGMNVYTHPRRIGR